MTRHATRHAVGWWPCQPDPWFCPVAVHCFVVCLLHENLTFKSRALLDKQRQEGGYILNAWGCIAVLGP